MQKDSHDKTNALSSDVKKEENNVYYPAFFQHAPFALLYRILTLTGQSLPQIVQLRAVNRKFRNTIDQAIIQMNAQKLMADLNLDEVSMAKLISTYGGEKFNELAPPRHGKSEQNEFQIYSSASATVLKEHHGFARLEFNDIDLTALQLKQPWFVANCRFTHVNFTNTTFAPNSEFIQCQFEKASVLTAAKLPQAHFKGVNIIDCDLPELSAPQSWWHHSNMSGINAENINLSYAGLQNTLINNAQFQGAAATSSVWMDCQIIGVQFTNANFSHSLFYNVTFNDCDFTNVNCYQWEMANVTFNYCIMPDGRKNNGSKIIDNPSIRSRAQEQLEALQHKHRSKPKGSPTSPNLSLNRFNNPAMGNHTVSRLDRELTSWMSTHNHPKIEKKKTSEALKKMSRVGYQNSPTNTPYVLYYIWDALLPKTLDFENDAVRQQAISDIQKLLQRLNPLLLYFAEDILSHFQAPDKAAKKLALDMIGEIPEMASLLKPNILRQNPSFTQAIINATPALGEDTTMAILIELNLLEDVIPGLNDQKEATMFLK